MSCSSSASSRRSASSSDSPCSSAPPGVIQTPGSPGTTNRWRKTRSRRSSRIARAAGRVTGRLVRASSSNQRSRSAHGTAAFAGEVEGSTKSRVCGPSVRSWTPSSGRSLNDPRYASLPTNASHTGSKSIASRSNRSALPAKSAPRRSDEPGVVRCAALVTPTPSSSASHCSAGVNSRRVKPASCSSRQKSLRGFAKCARAAAETRPGLIPQNSTRRCLPRTSGIALCVSVDAASAPALPQPPWGDDRAPHDQRYAGSCDAWVPRSCRMCADSSRGSGRRRGV